MQTATDEPDQRVPIVYEVAGRIYDDALEVCFSLARAGRIHVQVSVETIRDWSADRRVCRERDARTGKRPWPWPSERVLFPGRAYSTQRSVEKCARCRTYSATASLVRTSGVSFKTTVNKELWTSRCPL